MIFQCFLSTSFRWLNSIENPQFVSKHLFVENSRLFSDLIRDSALEVNIDYRRTLMKSLSAFVDRLKIFVVRHVAELIDLLDDAAESFLLRKICAQILTKLVDSLRFRIDFHRDRLLKVFLRLSIRNFQENRNDSQLNESIRNFIAKFSSFSDEKFVETTFRTLIDDERLDKSLRLYFKTFFLVDQ